MKNIISILLCSMFGVAFSQVVPDSLVHKDFSGQVFVQKENKVILNHVAGFADYTFKIKNTDSTLFELGQVSEVFIYHFIEHLASINQIKVTDNVSKYLADFPYKNIQIKHLLNHQSGLPKTAPKLILRANKRGRWNERFDNFDVLGALKVLNYELEFAPGSKTEYSELDFIVLAQLIERITFTPMADFVDRFFTHQDFTIKPIVNSISDSLLNKANAYQLNMNKLLPANNLKDIGMPFNDGTLGNKHFFMSASDLVLWSSYLLKDVDFDFLKSKGQEMNVKGFVYYPKFNAIIARGEFGGNTCYLIRLENGVTIAYNSNVLTPNSFEQNVNRLIKNFVKI